MAGKQIRMFLVDGTVGGLVTAEIHNWTGHLLKGKRERLQDMLERDEAQRTGVYILFGEDPESIGKKAAYIGQADVLAARLKNHKTNKAFWDEVVMITSKDSNLTSAHVRYLEAKLCQLATEIGRVRLENVVAPSGGAPLPEADASDMDYFIEQIKIVLPVLGYELLRGRVRPRAEEVEAPVAVEVDPTISPEFFLKMRSRQVDAKAQVIDGEFTVLAGSKLAGSMGSLPVSVASSTRKQHASRETMRNELTQEGALVIENGNCVVTRDIVFSSPSAAGAVAVGRGTLNGRTAWKTAEGTTFAEWEDNL